VWSFVCFEGANFLRKFDASGGDIYGKRKLCIGARRCLLSCAWDLLGALDWKHEDRAMNTKSDGTPKFGSNTYNKHDDHKGHAPRRARGKKRMSKAEMLEQMKKNAADKS